MIADILNGIGGIGFFIGCSFFLKRYLEQGKINDILFTAHCLLFGMAAVLFEFAAIWDIEWWWWHILRLAAYMILLYFFYKDFEYVYKSIKDARDAAIRANRMKSEFLANMSHELRTPLNSLLILAEGFAENVDKNLTPEQVDDAKIILGSGKDLLTLINDILDLAKVEAGRMSLNIDDLSIEELVNNLQVKFRPLAYKKNLYLKVSMEADVPQFIRSDKTRLEQILRNFLSNAFKFTHDGGVSIRIYHADPKTLRSGTANGEMIAFAISDTGIGIPKEKLGIIFEAFQQADGSTSRQYGGTGLGLSIAREFSRLLSGEITVESEEGKGSIFTLYLPVLFTGITDINNDTLDSGENVAPADRQIQKIHEKTIVDDDRATIQKSDIVIMLIDDDARFTRILREKIRKKGHKCIIANDGITGLQLLSTYRPQAVVLDIELPDISGLEVYQRIKQDAPSTAVYFMSVHDDIPTLITENAIGCLTKPVSMEMLDHAFSKIEKAIYKPLKNILVVEDDERLRTTVAAFIRAKNIEVKDVSNAYDALEVLKKEKPDCMLLDLMMPEVDGIELLEMIAADKKITMPRVIVYSAKDLTESEKRRLGFYTKTFIQKNGRTPEEMLDTLLSLNGDATIGLEEENSSFTATVPEAASSQLQSRTSTAVAEGGESDYAILDGKKVLIADDDMRNTYALSKILKNFNMNIVMASDGKKAVELLDANPDTDIVLMDIMMPIMSGHEAIVHIRKQPRYANLPIIAVTAMAMREDGDKCLSVGATDYLSKPVDKEKLIEKMVTCLRAAL